MAKTNIRKYIEAPRTHEGGLAARITPKQELVRSVLACMLFEDTFYESGKDAATRVFELASEVAKKDSSFVQDLAVRARGEFNLRHVPLWLICALASVKELRKETVVSVIQRADELAEVLAMYWKDGKKPIPAQMKNGLAEAFCKFNAYQLQKWDRKDAKIRLRDVMFLVHPKPEDEAQTIMFKQLADQNLPVADTWEVALSGGADKKETWERLLREKKLGGMALLRNLRNMYNVDVSNELVFEALANMNKSRILPFRFIAAARTNPYWEAQIENAMLGSLEGMERLHGKTVCLLDVSGSMDYVISYNSEIRRIDAGAALGILFREMAEECRIFTFSNELVEIPSRRGFALRDAINESQEHGGTFLANSMKNLVEKGLNTWADRLVIVTDEQSHDGIGDLNVWKKGYTVNVAGYENGVGYGRNWVNITGWSDAVVKYMQEYEKERGDIAD